jgi:cellobiose phosphorylase
MRFGYFDDQRREYVITRPDTPLPWINYLGSQDYIALISNTAGGYSFYKDASLRRITRYRYNNVPLDSGGRYLYLRDRETGQFWSPTWQPTRMKLDSYSCRHGLGYTTISSIFTGIKTEIRYFVPVSENLEVWDAVFSNQRDEAAQLDIFSCLEFALWDARDDATNFQRNLSIGEVEIEDGVIYHKTEYRERRDHFAYHACSEPTAGYDTQRGDFLGPYRGWENPIVVERGACTGSIAHGWAPIGSLQINIPLSPGETRRVIFLLGYRENPKEQKFDPPGSNKLNKHTVKPVIQRFLDPLQIDAAFEDLSLHWEGLLGKFRADTPDLHTDRLVNIWNPYQCMVTFNLSRSASYFESGVGRGMGFRDSCQDLLGFVHMVPDRARQRILDLAATQLENGGAFHQYQPLTKRGNDAVGSNFNDDPLWLPLAVTAYIKETGDFSILEEQVPFENKPGTEKSLYEHLRHCLDYTLARLGPHGLPLIGRADWNDCLNLNTFSEQPGESFQTTTSRDGKTAESVFIAGLFCLAAREMAQLAGQVGKASDEIKYNQAAAEMGQTTLKHGWDGEWFRRAYDDFGQPVGSINNQEGRIFIEPQGMCVLGGIGIEQGLAEQALDSVAEHLATPHGIVLNQPAYQSYHLQLGEISSYPPGYKENAGVFCHNNPWIMIAETQIGRGDRAHDYYTRINPSAREAISELHRCEPYVYAQMIAGRDAFTPGEAKNSWLTGTAAWNFVAVTQWILGIRPDYNGLVISPVIPSNWDGFEIQRVFRGVRYNIRVERMGTGNEILLEMDGERIDGNLIPLPEAGTGEAAVTVKIGKKKSG